MRPAGQLKMGYYPTPPGVVDRLIRLLHFPARPTNALDPCAGEGLALEQLTRGKKEVVTYGIELDGARAGEADVRLDQVLHAGYEDVQIPPGSIGLLFLNPPYDDGEGERKELIFLRDLAGTLLTQGVLVYIIPQKRLSREIAALLATHFSDLRVYRFPDAEYEAFGQIVVLGRKTRWPLSRPEEAARLAKLANETLETLPEYGWYPEIPAADEVVLEVQRVKPEDLVKMAAKSPLWARVRDLTEPAILAGVDQPPTRLHVGHLGLLLSAGRLNGLVGKGPDRHIVVGQPVRKFVESEETEYDDKGNATAHIERRLETFQVVIKMLTAKGEIRYLGGAPEQSGQAPASA